jgi:type II secretory pathway predicted ATPase ExeA
MYEEFFHLHHRPFTAVPQVERYYPASAIEQARKTVARCIDRAEGAALIIGSAGTGKSLLCQVLARQFSARYQTVVLTCGHLGTRRALLQAILFELDQPYRGLDEGELRLSLVDHLVENAEDSSGLVLLIDEAHTLPLRLLEELRLITNLAVAGQPRIRVVLAGNGTLEELFASPKLDSFSQRVAARCYLGSFDRAETAAYVRHQIAMSGGNPDAIVATDSLESLYRATDGIPRLINQVCDHALILANLAGKMSVDRNLVEEAWADLQQLPAPWAGGAATSASSGSVIEFGELDAVENAAEAADEEVEQLVDDFSDELEEELVDEVIDDAADEAPTALPFRRANNAKPATDLETQLTSIDNHLAQYEEDFRPAGLIGPEVELVFADQANPFEEEFADEEVIIDRYAAIDTGSFAGLPSVSSVEGRILGAHLVAAGSTFDLGKTSRESSSTTIAADVTAKPMLVKSAQPAPTVEFSTLAIGDTVATTPLSTSYLAPKPPAVQPAAVAAGQIKSFETTTGPGASPAVALQPEPIVSLRSTAPLRDEGLPLSEIRTVAADDSEDRDLIVVEDDLPTAPVPPRGKPLVRRQEYRQLFAKLRRG